MKQARRKYSQEFKQEAVQLVTKQGYTFAQASGSLGIRENMLRRWEKSLTQNGSSGIADKSKPAEPPEVEMRQLREEVRRLRMEREILKKAAVFFAKETE